MSCQPAGHVHIPAMILAQIDHLVDEGDFLDRETAVAALLRHGLDAVLDLWDRALDALDPADSATARAPRPAAQCAA